jgi:hypothetical protein
MTCNLCIGKMQRGSAPFISGHFKLRSYGSFVLKILQMRQEWLVVRCDDTLSFTFIQEFRDC